MAKIRKANRNINFYPILLLIATLFMSIGYASINNITLDISGTVMAKSQDGVFITDVKLLNGTGEIISYHGTILGTNTTLLNKEDSEVTYEITIYNSTEEDIPYFGEIYDKEDNSLFYTNPNIEYEVSISKGTNLPSKGEITFTITFKYKNNVVSERNNLKSYIQFVFIQNVYLFDYTGSEQNFAPPIKGTYKIELWGAQGGSYHDNYKGGNGGYVSGEIQLNKNDKLYIYVGQMPNDYNGGYNGGGSGTHDFLNNNIIRNFAGGGGATDVRLISGNWNDFNSLKSRIMVAGGGSGGYYWDPGASTDNWSIVGQPSGGLIGYHYNNVIDTCISYGGSQISGGICDNYVIVSGGFGYGGIGGSTSDDASAASGGGSGYYGGAGRVDLPSSSSVGGGGSSFISGHDGCDAIHEQSTIDNIIHTEQSIHYSGYVFKNTIIIDGKGCKWTDSLTTECAGMPDYDGISAVIGNVGNGYAKITLISID